MLIDWFAELPPELTELICTPLPTPSLNSFASTCCRLHEILRASLEARITPELGQELFLWAAASKPHVIAKLLSPPHSLRPVVRAYTKTPLHVAAEAGNLETATLLLAAGADPTAEWEEEFYQPLHLAASNNHLAMVTLLLDHGAPIDSSNGFEGYSENALHHACRDGRLNMVELLLARGAALGSYGDCGTPLGVAVHRCQLEVARLLLQEGADVGATVPLYRFLSNSLPPPLEADMLYVAMDLRAPTKPRVPLRHQRARWEGSLSEDRKQLMAGLLAHGASKDTTMATINKHLAALAKEAQYTEAEFLETIEGMFKKAEEVHLERPK